MLKKKELFPNFFISPEIISSRQFKGFFLTATLTRQTRTATNPETFIFTNGAKLHMSTSLSLKNILKSAFTEKAMMYASPHMIGKLLNFNWLLYPSYFLPIYVIDLDILTLEVFTKMLKDIYFVPKT